MRRALPGKHIAALIVLIAVGIALLSPMLAYPFSMDQALFSVAADMLREGKVLYRDIWDQKPPAVYYLYVAAISLFGHRERSVFLFDLLWTLATALALLALARRLLRSFMAAWFAGLLFLTLYALRLDCESAAQADGFASLPVILALLAALGGTERRSRLLLAAAGLCVGIAVLLKTTLAAFLVLPVALVLASDRERRSQALLLACTLGGFALPLGAAALALARAGTLREFWRIVFVWNLRYASVRRPELLWPSLSEFVLGETLVAGAIGVLAVLGLFACGKSKERWWWVAPLWLGLALAQIWLQGKYFRYHWHPAIPPLAVLSAYGLQALVARFGSRRPAFAWGALSMLLALGLLTAKPPPKRQPWLHPEVAQFIAAHTSPTDRVFIWGRLPQLYWWSGRRPANRFLHNPPLIASWSPPEWKESLLADLSASRPALVLVVDNDAAPDVYGYPYSSLDALHRNPRLLAALAEHYRLISHVANVSVLGRRLHPLDVRGSSHLRPVARQSLRLVAQFRESMRRFQAR